MDEGILKRLEDCGQRLAIVQAALYDANFRCLAKVIERVDADLEEIYNDLEAKNNVQIQV